MKKTSLLILASTLTLGASSMAIAIPGSVPECTSGVANIEIYNKNIDACEPDGKSEYCMYDLEVRSNDHNHKDCTDYMMVLKENSNESHSLSHRGSKLEVHHYLYTKGGPKMADLHFVYHNGSFTNNCAKVFGPDVSCVTTVTGSAKHRLYKVTISRHG